MEWPPMRTPHTCRLLLTSSLPVLVACSYCFSGWVGLKQCRRTLDRHAALTLVCPHLRCWGPLRCHPLFSLLLLSPLMFSPLLFALLTICAQLPYEAGGLAGWWLACAPNTATALCI
ncbi:hypothetical protein V8C86DRAFT_19068 [Haematococcus lacustris]